MIDLGRQLPLGEFASFGVIGLVCFGIDIVIFNVLLFTMLEHEPALAKLVSTVAAASATYVLNRHWTWRHRARLGTRRELPSFIGVSAVGLAITEICLLVSHYGLGLTSRASDNIAANVVGLALATIFRFWGYQRFVFLTHDRAASLTRRTVHADARIALSRSREQANAEI